jgi:hypothetical protein
VFAFAGVTPELPTIRPQRLRQAEEYRAREEMRLEWGSPGSDRQLPVSQQFATNYGIWANDGIWANADEEVGVPVHEMQLPNTGVFRWPRASVTNRLDQNGQVFTSPRIPEIGSGEI